MAVWSETQLIRAIEQNRFEAFASLGQSPYGVVEEDAEMLCIFTNIPVLSPLCGWIFRAKLQLKGINRKIDQAVSRFASRKLPLIWNTGPSTRPPDLEKYLLEYGFTRVFELAGMAVELKALTQILHRPPRLEIEPVADAQTLEQWAGTFAAAFKVDGKVGGSIYQLFEHLVFDPTIPWHLFLGMLDGKPVATSAMYIGAEVAGIYFVGTLPEVRKRGIGSLATLAPLKMAMRMGCEIAVLHASPMATGMYRSLGFQEYCRMGLFAWQPDE